MARAKIGFKQSELSLITGLSQMEVSRAERGKRKKDHVDVLMKAMDRVAWKMFHENMRKEDIIEDMRLELMQKRKVEQDKNGALKLGVLVGEARRQARFTQDELADLLGTNRTALSNVENGVSIPHKDFMGKFQELFGESKELMYLWEEEKKKGTKMMPWSRLSTTRVRRSKEELEKKSGGWLMNCLLKWTAVS